MFLNQLSLMIMCLSLVPRPTLREERAWYPLFALALDLNSKLEEGAIYVNFTSRVKLTSR